MKNKPFIFLSLLALTLAPAGAAVRYVNLANPSPAPPYTTWASAATTIQDAIDAADAGDEIVVTNGVYQTGGRVVNTSLLRNRVVVTKPLIVRSVNGPEVTVILGYQVPGARVGDGAIRCVYLSTGAALIGFTLTNGATRAPGGGDSFEQNGGGAWCESANATMSNCVFSGNSADSGGGGVFQGTLVNCTLTGNSVGPHFYESGGGGALFSTLSNCLLTANSSTSGGGAASSTLNNCTLSANSASDFGGGAYSCTLNNCTVTGNSAGRGGGVSDSTLNNCIVYYNHALGSLTENYSGGAFNYSCTTPLPKEGIANINSEPKLASSSRLNFSSPCHGAGSAAYTSGVDIDGESWSKPPSMGCDEPHSEAMTGPLSVVIVASYTNLATGFEINFVAQIGGRTVASAWEFGDGTTLSNRPYASHAWTVPGDYQVVLRAFNESNPSGSSATVMVHVVNPPVHYVNWGGVNPTAPFSSWETAATNIQNAVDAASVPGAWVLVTNGIYQTGEIVGNVVTIINPLTLRSINGPQATVIDGRGSDGRGRRCVSLGEAGMLIGFTLTNGYGSPGGGVLCADLTAVVSNCVIIGNTSTSPGGGGAAGGTLNNCVLINNYAEVFGGGAYGCTLNNCTLDGNGAGCVFDCQGGGGGAAYSILNNCTLTGNYTAEDRGPGGGGAYGCTLINCALNKNAAGTYGGGTTDSTLNDCTLTGNSAGSFGGGARGGTLNNCTVTGNSAGVKGGGVQGGTDCTFGCVDVLSYLNNCIVYFNLAPTDPNYSACAFAYSCTTPLPPGVGNIDADPQLTLTSHLWPGSPCIGAGNAADAVGVDIDGEAWANPPSIGCDEYHAGAITGPLTLDIQAGYTNVATGFAVEFHALIGGRISAGWWDFGDGTLVSNRQFAAHAWAVAGDYPVVLRAHNESHPEGVSATIRVHVVEQSVHYVAAGSSNPVAPYKSWVTAATTIQDAVDAAYAGGTILVTNGVYQTVAVTKPLTVRSVNGPELTVIGGDGAVRCVYLAEATALVGFTLTNGFAEVGGGVWCASVSAMVSNCVLTGNSAAELGGGVYSGTLNNCTLTGNWAGAGGGVSYSILNNCTLSGNSANEGGGANGGTLNNCTLSGNSASYGGGAYSGTLNNCTLTGNSASYTGGGAYSGELNNCIVYYNIARQSGDNYSGGTFNYSCATPLPPGGAGNISVEPQLASASHLSAGSPCRGTGSAAYATGADIDGEAWANPPSIGCDELQHGPVTGSLSVAIVASYTNVATGFEVNFTAQISGRTSLSRWVFGDGTVVSNRPYTAHGWVAPGDYAVVLWAYNQSYPAGVSTTVTVHVVESPVHYVTAGSSNPTVPYNSWATAATNIQDAVDAAVPGALVLVTNGVYQASGRVVAGALTNRVALTKPLAVRSVNGPRVTTIAGFKVPGTTNGDSAVRCVYLAEGATLVGFTLTNGATRSSGNNESEQSGGGVWCTSASAVVSNCVLSGNVAYGQGGGAYQGTLNNCVLSGNSADTTGGAAVCTLNNCTVTGNFANSFGGVYGGTLNNCIVYYNVARHTEPNHVVATFNYSCTTPLPGGVGNFDNPPLFVDPARGNWRLQPNSPCINAGFNASASGGMDLDGNPRIVGGTVDIGAYELQNPASTLSYAWLYQFGLPTDGSADFADQDGDHFNNFQEWRASTDPMSPLSALRLLTPIFDGSNWLVSWQSVPERTYTVERIVDLSATNNFLPVARGVPGQSGTTTVIDTNSPARGPTLYRVRVEE